MLTMRTKLTVLTKASTRTKLTVLTMLTTRTKCIQNRGNTEKTQKKIRKT